jgi:hypothetical protein
VPGYCLYAASVTNSHAFLEGQTIWVAKTRFRHIRPLTIYLVTIMSSKLNKCFNHKNMIWLLGLLLALGVAPSVLLAQEWDHFDGRDKVHDPTGAWLVRFNNHDDPILNRNFFLIVFHKGGTLTQNTQGESGFDPSAVPLPLDDPNSENNVIRTAFSGVWQKTGWNTFAGTLLDIEYHNSLPAANPRPDVALFQFTKEQFIGRITESGDQMVLSEVRHSHFGLDGKEKTDKNGVPLVQVFLANGVRIPLEILPHTSHTLPIPPLPK